MSTSAVQSSVPASSALSSLFPAVATSGSTIIQPNKKIGLATSEPQPLSLTAGSTHACSPQAHCVQFAHANTPGLWITMLPSLVSAVLVIVGWYVVNKAQSNRERRKQIREYVADLRKDLEVLELLVIGYHTNNRDEIKEQEIISKLGRFEKACSTLPRFLNSQKFIKAVQPGTLNISGPCLQTLRKTMTLNHFGDEHAEALNRQSEFIENFELAADDVQNEFERIRIDSLD